MTSPAARISVVIPTLNEERYLPFLLSDLGSQTIPVHEVIVADAGSSDATVAIAECQGALVVPGGHPGVGRNRGAEAATGDMLLFLDADIRLESSGLEVALDMLTRNRLDAVSCWFRPDHSAPFLRLNHWMSCQYFRLSSKLGWPHAIGAFLLLPRSLHDEIGGFDTTVRVAEDQDYVRRVAKVARYGFVRQPVVTVATRRFETEGNLGTSLKWLGIELHRAALGEIRGEYFRYFK